MSCCLLAVWICASFFFFNDTATTEIYTLSLHDALPILDRRLLPSGLAAGVPVGVGRGHARRRSPHADRARRAASRRLRSEEHTSELQSQSNLVCRLLLEKKKNMRSVCRRPTFRRT